MTGRRGPASRRATSLIVMDKHTRHMPRPAVRAAATRASEMLVRTVKHGGVYTMNAKRTMKKILALGAGVAMVGATIMGAMATYDLATYPAPFITNGVFDGEIVLGSTAKVEFKAVERRAVPIPGAPEPGRVERQARRDVRGAVPQLDRL